MPDPKMMSLRVAVFAAAAGCAGLTSAFSQTAPAPAAAPAPSAALDQPVILDPFHVASTGASSYSARDANGAGRIAMPLQDTPESISVITKQFIEDLGANSVLDAVRFTASATDGQFENRLDRITMRGFQQDPAQSSQYIDGFRYSMVSAGFNQDPADLERIEVIKGPNAILAAAGSPGGALNFVTKSPEFTAAAYLKGQYSEYLGNQGEIDVTGPLPYKDGKTLAYRLVALYAYSSNGYLGNEFDRHYWIAPSFTWRIDDRTTFTLKGNMGQNFVPGLMLPLDPRVGTANGLAIYPGLGARSQQGGPESEGGFFGNHASLSGELTHVFNDHFQMRLGEMAITGHLNPTGGNITAIGGVSTSGTTGNVNPYNGVFTPGTTWAVNNYGLPTQNVTSTPATLPNFGNRAGTYTLTRQWNGDNSSVLQNDYVGKFEVAPGFTSTTIIGGSLTTHTYTNYSFNNVNVPLVGTVDNPNWAATYANALAQPLTLNANYSVLETTRMGYIAEIFRAFHDTLIASFNLGDFAYKQRFNAGAMITSNPLGIGVPIAGYPGLYSPTPGYASVSGERATKSGGVVYKPVKQVAVWGGYTENVNPPVINNLGGTSRFDQHGDQSEGGVKTSWFDDQLSFTATYFSIDEHNVFVYDAISNTFLPEGDVHSRGWEFEANGRLTPELNVIGSFSAYHARNSFGQLLRSVPDTSGALALRYQFNRGILKGLWLMPTANYLGKRAGDIPGTINIVSSTSIYAADPAQVALVNGHALNGAPVQPTFFVPARTIFNFDLGYNWGRHWVFRGAVLNATNKTYIATALNRGVITPGDPINFRGSIEYHY